MRLVLIAGVSACIFFLVGRAVFREDFGVGSLVDLRTQSTPDETRLRISGKLGSGVKYLESISSSREGSAVLLTIAGNLSLFVLHYHTPYFDRTFDIPADVSEVRAGRRREIIWRRGDCHNRYQSYDGWHCDPKDT
jgi:hypothetical protein